jgi:hypothetical protein
MRFMIWRDDESHNDQVHLPPSWTKATSLPKLAELPDQLTVARDSCHTWRTYTGWEISLMLARHVGDALWRQHGGHIYASVLEIGLHLGVPEDVQAPSDTEAEWRSECWHQLDAWVLPRPENPGNPPPLRPRLRAAKTLASTATPPSGAGPSSPSNPNPSPPSNPNPSPPSKPARTASAKSLHRRKPYSRPGGLVPVRPGFIGLENFRASCYLNAPLQCLLHLDSLNHYFDDEWPKIQNRNPPDRNGMTDEYARLRALMNDDPPTFPWVVPQGFMTTLHRLDARFSPTTPEEANVLMDCLLNLLHDDIICYNRAAPDPDPTHPDADLYRLPPPARSIMVNYSRSGCKRRLTATFASVRRIVSTRYSSFTSPWITVSLTARPHWKRPSPPTSREPMGPLRGARLGT